MRRRRNRGGEEENKKKKKEEEDDEEEEEEEEKEEEEEEDLFVWSSSTTRLNRGRAPRLTSDNDKCCHNKTEWGDHDFCFSRSHYTDTDPTSRERATAAGIEPGTSSPGVARSTD